MALYFGDVYACYLDSRSKPTSGIKRRIRTGCYRLRRYKWHTCLNEWGRYRMDRKKVRLHTLLQNYTPDCLLVFDPHLFTCLQAIRTLSYRYLFPKRLNDVIVHVFPLSLKTVCVLVPLIIKIINLSLFTEFPMVFKHCSAIFARNI